MSLLWFLQNNKADLIRIQIEKEQMERTQREGTLLHVLMEVRKRLKLFGFSPLSFLKNAEKARIEAEMRAATIATRMRAVNELKQQRERERLELEKVFFRNFKNRFVFCFAVS